MKSATLLKSMLIGVSLLSAGQVLAGENQGAASIVLDGGSRGSVTFPHGRHQNVFVDCMPCHGLFAKESHVIDKMKEEGRLQKKEVMDMCKNCHKDLAARGEKAGPTSCSACHQK